MRHPITDAASSREAGAASEATRESSDRDRRILESLDALAREAEDSASGEFGPAIAAFRRLCGYTRRQLAADLTRELELPDESTARVKLYLADLENGLMSARRVATRVHDALARLLRVEPDELIAAARFSRSLTKRDARAYARASRSSMSSRRGERPLPWDQVDALFLGAGEREEDVGEAPDVERAAAALLATFKPAVAEPPVPVDELAEEMEGLDIQEAENLGLVPGAPEVPPGTRLSGLLLPGEKRIWVSAEDARRSEGRRRFTIAHELGHWRLHADRGKHARAAIYCRPDEVLEGAEGLVSDKPIEAEANRFAAALLMPDGLVRRDARDHKLSVPLLAKRFGVSAVAMKLRLDALDLLPPYMR